MNVADAGRDINANRLGSYLARQKDRLRAGFKFEGCQGRAATMLWRLEKVP